ncbi:hypothetical protein V1525DRAFT_412424 [Lipomyces kononenkoae]|uniref:Uncharacterized protein n=1 Tax=Lipomyces kononenkoae TaxID=34357 RepID=A0ACC3SSP7_LIPKO
MAFLRFVTVATLVALIASVGTIAVPRDVYLRVKSENATINGMGLASIQENDGVNYVFLEAGPQLLVYESDNSTIYDPTIYQILPNPYYLQFSGSLVMISIASNNPTRFRIDANSYLTYNGSQVVFYATKNTDDPNNYSLYAYQALYYGTDGKFAPNGSISFKVYAELAGYPNASTTSSAAPTTSAKPSTATLYPNATSSRNNVSNL